MNLLYLLLLFASIDFCRSKKCEDTTTRGTVAPSTVRPTRKPPVGNNAPKPVISFDYPESTTVRTTTVATVNPLFDLERGGRPGGIYSTSKSATARITVATVTRTTDNIEQWRKPTTAMPRVTVPANTTVPTKTTVTPIRITRRVGSPGIVTVVKIVRGGARGDPVTYSTTKSATVAPKITVATTTVPIKITGRVTVPDKVSVATTKSKKNDLRMPTVPPSIKTTKTATSRVTVPTTRSLPTTVRRVTVPLTRKTTTWITVPTVRTTKKVPMGVNEKKKEPVFYPIAKESVQSKKLPTVLF